MKNRNAFKIGSFLLPVAALLGVGFSATAFAQTVSAPPTLPGPTLPPATLPPSLEEDVVGTLEQDDTSVAIPPLTTPAEMATLAGSTKELGRKISAIIANDLSGSGLFRPIGPDGMRGITMGEVTAPAFGAWSADNLIHGYVRSNPDGTLSVGCYLYDLSEKSLLSSKAFVVPPKDWRRAAHKCADSFYSKMSGESPFFDSRIVYVAETGPKNRRVKRIAVMDSDGANHRFLTNGQNIVLTPRYSPDYKKILYLSYVDKRPRIYVLDVASGKQNLIVQANSQTFSPRWSPDGKSILYSMENAGITDIYRVAASGGQAQKLTAGPGINIGGSFSPDGSKIIFESDRTGFQQIYMMNADGSNTQRISPDDGSQYATPEWSPRGDLIAFTRIGGGAFRVGVMTPAGTGIRMLTNSWQDEAPTWSPNGRVIQFFRTDQGSGATRVWQVDVTGAKLRRIETPTSGSDPSWGAIQQ
jgi:TolB protein